jgi:hypothetical protein
MNKNDKELLLRKKIKELIETEIDTILNKPKYSVPYSVSKELNESDPPWMEGPGWDRTRKDDWYDDEVERKFQETDEKIHLIFKKLSNKFDEYFTEPIEELIEKPFADIFNSENTKLMSFYKKNNVVKAIEYSECIHEADGIDDNELVTSGISVFNYTINIPEFISKKYNPYELFSSEITQNFINNEAYFIICNETVALDALMEDIYAYFEEHSDEIKDLIDDYENE